MNSSDEFTGMLIGIFGGIMLVALVVAIVICG